MYLQEITNYKVETHPFLRIKDLPQLPGYISQHYEKILKHLAKYPRRPPRSSRLRRLENLLYDCYALKMTWHSTGVTCTLVYQLDLLRYNVKVISFAEDNKLAIDRAEERILHEKDDIKILREDLKRIICIRENNESDYVRQLINLVERTQTSLMSNSRNEYTFNAPVGSVENQGSIGSSGSQNSVTNAAGEANIANFANQVRDNARQITENFHQNIEQNLDELTKLIYSLREMAKEFPEAQREEAIVHLDDLQEDLTKPEKQKPQRIKTRIVALSAIAGFVVGAADFSNNVAELAEKLGVTIEFGQHQPDRVNTPPNPKQLP